MALVSQALEPEGRGPYSPAGGAEELEEAWHLPQLPQPDALLAATRGGGMAERASLILACKEAPLGASLDVWQWEALGGCPSTAKPPPGSPSAAEAVAARAVAVQAGRVEGSRAFWQRHHYGRRSRAEPRQAEDLRPVDPEEALSDYWHHTAYKAVASSGLPAGLRGTGGGQSAMNAWEPGHSLPRSGALADFAEDLAAERSGTTTTLQRALQPDAAVAPLQRRRSPLLAAAGRSGDGVAATGDPGVTRSLARPRAGQSGGSRTAAGEAHILEYGAAHATDLSEPVAQAYNNPLAERQREAKWRQQECRGLPLGGAALAARAVQESTSLPELLEIAPCLASCCYEATKEAALRAAVRLGEAAEDHCDQLSAAGVKELQQAALALIASVASRARDAHGPDFLVDTLVGMERAGVGERVYVDMVLAALWGRIQREPLPGELAERAAGALCWAAEALTDSDPPGSLRLGAGSRRAVAAIRDALPKEVAAAADESETMLRVLEHLSSGAAWLSPDGHENRPHRPGLRRP